MFDLGWGVPGEEMSSEQWRGKHAEGHQNTRCVNFKLEKPKHIIFHCQTVVNIINGLPEETHTGLGLLLSVAV